MKISFRITLIVTLLLSGRSFAGGAFAQNLPPGEGHDVVQAVCLSCHGEDVIVSIRYEEDEWNDVVLRMIGNGLYLTDEQYEVVLKYLTNTLGPRH